MPRTFLTAATLALMLGAVPALAQTGSPYMQQRPGSVRPNSQNLMQGPSSWTAQQRRLNVPGATANPSQKRNTLPYTAPPPPAPPTPKPQPEPVRPAETPDE
ncbi:hypothetical protein MWN33_16235 [Starkeya koreensis]|uniref:Uncharacterized protein n=1 Tax=Ancylobacter koreensis TaxID=266121 RepID=A0ABT0DQM5_9HYPH|nr:hypothetical protein [Ancylobacter koreensis]